MTLDTLSVEYADRNSPGCAMHENPECLCDVDLSRGVVGDGPYNVGPLLRDAFVDGLDDTPGAWFGKAFVTMVEHTAVTEFSRRAHIHKQAAAAALLLHGASLREAIVLARDTGSTWKDVGVRFGVNEHVIGDIAKALVVPSVRPCRPAAPKYVRDEVVRMYDDGMSVFDICNAMEASGLTYKRNTVHQWVYRHSARHLRERTAA